MVGRVFGDRYEILARLARGGMATVYRAHDRRLNRDVAVKVMHEGLGDDVDFAAKFDREARAAARLSHPNVVSVFDQGRDDGRPYIVMECVEGRTLRSVISREAPLSPLRALDHIEPAVRALAAAHEAGLVHRDVKPENVLIADRGVIKVTDFGLAKAITAQTATATQGLLIGTVSYLPPELVTQAKADARSDIYSTGIVLFELLTGRKPHTGDTPIAVAYSHVHNDVPAPSSVHSDRRAPIPPYIDALVRACTSRDPALRPADGRALQMRVALARRALLEGVTDDPALTLRLGGGPHLDEPSVGPHAHSPITSATPSTADSAVSADTAVTPVIGVAKTPTEQSTSWRHLTDPRRFRPRASTPVSPVDFEYSLDGVTYDPSTVARTITSAKPLVRVSQQRVHRRRRGLVALLLVILLGLGAGGASWYWFSEGRWVATPALVDLTEQDATAAAAAAILGVSVSKEYSETVPAGRVIRTDPAPGQRILHDGTVKLWVSQGPERFDVPTLVGLTKDAATAALAKANLVIGGVTEAYDEKAAPGTIVSASLAPGTKAKRGTPVDIVVSKGPKPIPITSWVGKPVAEAKAALEAAGFTVTLTEENSKTVAKGLVISQNPAQGEGKRGDAVALVVSKGPVMVQVPNVRGKSKDAAVATLKDAGFQTATKSLVGGGIAFGIAYGTDPAAGTSVPEGSTVTVLIG
jgi:serine/threonine-protein kinase